MPINYALFQNNLTTDPSDCAAQIQLTQSVDLDALVKHMVNQGSTVTEADIVAVLEDAIKACELLLLDGARVNFGGLCELYPRLKGVFNGITDTYDPARHQVDVGASPGARIRKTVRENASVVKQETILPAPAPLEYVDLGSGETNGQITPSNIGTVNGHRLKFDPAQADEGIYLISVPPGADHKVTEIQKNKPGQLVFLVPAGVMPGTSYNLEVRARMTNGTDLRVGRLDATLTA